MDLNLLMETLAKAERISFTYEINGMIIQGADTIVHVSEYDDLLTISLNNGTLEIPVEQITNIKSCSIMHEENITLHIGDSILIISGKGG